jgi:transposase
VERSLDCRGKALGVLVESPPGVAGCPACVVVARSHGRRTVEFVDAPCFGRPVTLRWRKRTWTCPDAGCPMGTFTEQDPHVAPRRALLTTRATRWAIGQLRCEHASGDSWQGGVRSRVHHPANKPLLRQPLRNGTHLRAKG